MQNTRVPGADGAQRGGGGRCPVTASCHRPHCHGQQDIPCLPLKMLQNPRICVGPCTLHIGLELVNMLDEAMIGATGEDVVTEEFYKMANATKSVTIPWRYIPGG